MKHNKTRYSRTQLPDDGFVLPFPFLVFPSLCSVLKAVAAIDHSESVLDSESSAKSLIVFIHRAGPGVSQYILPLFSLTKSFRFSSPHLWSCSAVSIIFSELTAVFSGVRILYVCIQGQSFLRCPLEERILSKLEILYATQCQKAFACIFKWFSLI